MPDEIEFTSEITCQLVRSLARDEDVVAAARVSVLGPDAVDADNSEKAGLINFLMKNRHGTPFEHNQFTFFTDAPIFVYRELHRHRIGISINEESGRYKEMRPKFYIPARERNLIQTGKAGHYIFSPGDDAQYRTLSNVLKGSFTDAWTDYRDLLKHGIAKEVARMCLPVSIFSSQYYTVNARSLMAILSLRKELTEEEAKFPSHPMKEINILVDKMEESFSTLMPITWASFVKNGYVSP